MGTNGIYETSWESLAFHAHIESHSCLNHISPILKSLASRNLSCAFPIVTPRNVPPHVSIGPPWFLMQGLCRIPFVPLFPWSVYVSHCVHWPRAWETSRANTGVSEIKNIFLMLAGREQSSWGLRTLIIKKLIMGFQSCTYLRTLCQVSPRKRIIKCVTFRLHAGTYAEPGPSGNV